MTSQQKEYFSMGKQPIFDKAKSINFKLEILIKISLSINYIDLFIHVYVK